ncbi:hypothetical protein NMG60_11024331 [Bertholletia excelsa]
MRGDTYIRTASQLHGNGETFQTPTLLLFLPIVSPKTFFLHAHYPAACAALLSGQPQILRDLFYHRHRAAHYSQTSSAQPPPVPPNIIPNDAKSQRNASRLAAKSSECDLEEETKPCCKSYNFSVSDSSEEREEWRVRLPKAEKKSKKKKKKKKKKKTTSSARISTLSIDSGCFSADDVDDREDTETESLISSSRSFDSFYDFGNALGSVKKIPIKEERRTKNNFKGKGRKHSGSKKTPPEKVNPARASVFRRLTPRCTTAEGKVRESFAVVKSSEDPCEDFKRSMLEMILENQMFEAEDLEQLLLCFLSLNSRHHHPAIVEAFAEIGDVLFC